MLIFLAGIMNLEEKIGQIYQKIIEVLLDYNTNRLKLIDEYLQIRQNILEINKLQDQQDYIVKEIINQVSLISDLKISNERELPSLQKEKIFSYIAGHNSYREIKIVYDESKEENVTLSPLGQNDKNKGSVQLPTRKSELCDIDK